MKVVISNDKYIASEPLPAENKDRNQVLRNFAFNII